MAIGATGFWEPLASLAYVHTEIDTLSLGTSGSVDFPSTVSFRGSLGARVGMSGDFQYYKVRVALTGRLWDEFDGDNTLLIISPGPSNFSAHDDMGGTFGEVTLGGNLFTTGNNLSAFANIGVKFRSDYQDTNVSVGFRYQW
jgi:outer membrane autotransporter protein